MSWAQANAPLPDTVTAKDDLLCDESHRIKVLTQVHRLLELR